MERTIAVIGAGKMGGALVAGMVGAGVVEPDRVVCADADPRRCSELAEAHGVRVSTDNRAAVASASVVLLAVKPQSLSPVVAEVADAVPPEAMVLSIAAGIPANAIEELLERPVPVVVAVPNLPATVGQGMVSIAAGTHATETHLATAEELLGAVGRVVRLPAHLIDAATAVSGSGPAYLLLVLEAMIDGGVRLGLPREVATELATQTAVGTATMLRETGEHPAVLREAVTSPGGTTAAALAYLEDHSVRGVVGGAVVAAHRRAQDLGRG